MNRKQNLLILVAISFLAYINIYQNAFLSDDLEGIVNNPQIGNLALAISSKNPVNIVNTIIYLIAGLSEPAFHLVNIIIHTANVLLVYLLITLLEKKRAVAFASALLFAIHPINTEAVAWISGKPYSLYTLFALISLIAFILYTKNRSKILILLSALSFLFSLYTSEKAMILPLVIVLYLFIFKKIKAFFIPFLFIALSAIPYLLTLGIILSQRISAINPAYSGGVTYYNPLIQIPTAISSYLELFILPINLTLYHEYLMNNPLELILKFSVTLVFLFILIFSFKKNKLLFFSLALFLISITPTLLPIMVGWIVAERYVYFGSIGLSLALTLSVFKIGELLKSKEIPIVLITSLSIFYLLFTWNRNSEWKSQDSLWPATITRSQYVPVAHNNMGDYYARHGDNKSAIEEFTIANKLTGGKYPEAIYNLATIYEDQNNFPQAIELYNKTISLDPTIIESYYRLSNINIKTKDLKTAEIWAKKALELDPKSIIANKLLEIIHKQSALPNK